MMSRTVVLLCALASAAHASSLDGNYADEQAQRRLSYERVYTYHPELKSWYNAKEYCASNGGNLATARNEAENDKIFELREGVDAWIGYTDLGAYSEEGVWVWQEDKSTADFINWATDEPDDAGGNEDCALLLSDKTWSDADCGLDFVDGEGSPFFCQTDLTYAPTYSPVPSSMPTSISYSYDDPETFDW